MASFDVEGDLVGASKTQLEYIKNVISELGLKVKKVIFAPVGIAGDNYAANVKRVTVEGEDETLSLVIKLAPENEMMRASMNSAHIFRNEHIMYTEVLPKMLALQKAAEVPETELLRFAKCYGSLDEEPSEVIILEDLRESGFVMENRLEALSEACVKSVLKNFAIFHSLSYVIKKEDPKLYDYFKTSLFDMWSNMNDKPEIKMYFEQSRNDAIGVLQSEQHIDVVKNRLESITSLSGKLSKQEMDSRFAVIQQGDSWTNNILFKFPDENTVESIMIDYQVSKNSNPASDILYMIFNCTDHKSRSQHFQEWMDYYHTELDKSLSNFGMKANYVYPRDQLDTDLKRYGKLMLGMTLMLSNILIRNPDEASKVKAAMEDTLELTEEAMAKLVETMKVSKLDDVSLTRYRNKIVGLVESCIQLGLV